MDFAKFNKSRAANIFCNNYSSEKTLDSEF